MVPASPDKPAAIGHERDNQTHGTKSRDNRSERPCRILKFLSTAVIVKNRGTPPTNFLIELVNWGKAAPEEIFAPRPNPNPDGPDPDTYSSVKGALGPWTSPLYRRAAMLEVMRVLAGFESSWHWTEGVDTTNSTSTTPETEEAGAWQVSMNAISFGQDLKDLTKNVIGTIDYKEGKLFQAAMKTNHGFAMEFIARLLRHTTHHNGPVLRHEIDPWLSKSAAREFEQLLG